MKYFEFKKPYYGLIKAKDEEEAIKVYTETIADDDPDSPLIDEIREVDRDYALVIHAQTVDETGRTQPAKSVLKNFNKDKKDVLAMDSLL